ncbi:MAG: hypothetical protein H7Z19_05300 [Chitinophagaceae bacterium]|nr:hypothetical protein [Rubrivivax sp.]
MSSQQMITVYSFRAYGGHAEMPLIGEFKAALETIKALGGEPVEGTAEQVARSELDERGRYRRIATGWGDMA